MAISRKLHVQVHVRTYIIQLALLPCFSCNYGKQDLANRTFSSEKAKDYANAGRCKCDDNTWECPAGAGGFPPPEARLKSGMRMYDLSGNDLSTSDHIKETFHDFIEDR